MRCPHCSALSKSSAKCSNCGGVIVAAIEKRPKRISPVGKRRQGQDYIYGLLREAFLILNPKCGVLGCHNLADQLHHKKGHIGYEDDWAREHNFTLYLDPRHFLQVCADHHREIEASPAKAKENGYSIDRLTK